MTTKDEILLREMQACLTPDYGEMVPLSDMEAMREANYRLQAENAELKKDVTIDQWLILGLAMVCLFLPLLLRK